MSAAGARFRAMERGAFDATPNERSPRVSGDVDRVVVVNATIPRLNGPPSTMKRKQVEYFVSRRLGKWEGNAVRLDWARIVKDQG